MTIGVIERLEVVDVQKQKRHGRRWRGRQPRLGERIIESPPVHEAGEAIGPCKLCQFQLGYLAQTDMFDELHAHHCQEGYQPNRTDQVDHHLLQPSPCHRGSADAEEDDEGEVGDIGEAIDAVDAIDR